MFSTVLKGLQLESIPNERNLIYMYIVYIKKLIYFSQPQSVNAAGEYKNVVNLVNR